jgi:peptide/nickel transport system permease protein
VAAIMFTWGIALPIGIYSAVYPYSFLDYAFTFIGFIGLAIPGFLLALVVMYVGFAYFGANVGGLFSPDFVEAPWTTAKVWDLVKHLPIPAIVLGVAGTAQLIRIMRSNLLDELRKPYVMTARARGLSEYRVVMRYPVRVALNPFVSTIGYLLPYVVSGSIIVSLVLSLPTVGRSAQGADRPGHFWPNHHPAARVMTVIGTFISDLLSCGSIRESGSVAVMAGTQQRWRRESSRKTGCRRRNGAHLGASASTSSPWLEPLC